MSEPRARSPTASTMRNRLAFNARRTRCPGVTIVSAGKSGVSSAASVRVLNSRRQPRASPRWSQWDLRYSPEQTAEANVESPRAGPDRVPENARAEQRLAQHADAELRCDARV